MKDTDKLREHLEKKVPEEVKDWNTQLQLSIAISLKRIADALEDGLTTTHPETNEYLGLADLIVRSKGADDG